MASYPASARFKFGDGRLGEVLHEADIPAGIVGNRGKLTAFALEADIPASWRKGALEAIGGRLDIPRDISALRKKGADIAMGVNRLGYYILSLEGAAQENGKAPLFRPRISNGHLRKSVRTCPMGTTPSL